jgi:hypothetical protein
MLSKLIRLTIFEWSVGVKITCAGVEDRLVFLLFWWYFHKVLDFNELELELKYFKDLPTTAEYEGFTL